MQAFGANGGRRKSEELGNCPLTSKVKELSLLAQLEYVEMFSMQKKDNRFDWTNCRAILVAVVVSTIIQHLVFDAKLIEYNMWRQFFLYFALFFPLYVFMLFIQGKFKKK